MEAVALLALIKGWPVNTEQAVGYSVRTVPTADGRGGGRSLFS